MKIHFFSLVFFISTVLNGVAYANTTRGTISTEIYVVLDYSLSVNDLTRGKYILSVEALINKLPEKTCISIFGTSDNSFDRPVEVLNRTCTGVPKTKLSNHLETIRNKILNNFKSGVELSKNKKSNKTDLIGAVNHIEVGISPLYNGRKLLIIFSDGQHDSRDIDLSKSIPTNGIQLIKDKGLLGDLSEVEIYFLGARAKKFTYFKNLKKFWVNYFSSANAKLEIYSNLHALPDKIFLN